MENVWFLRIKAVICPRLTTSVSGGLDVWQHHRQRWILPWLYIPPLLFLGLGPWWLGLVWSLNILAAQSEALCTPTHTHTHTLTTAMSHLSNSSVRDHMKWVSVFFLFFICIFCICPHLFWKIYPSFSFDWLFCVLTFCNSLPQTDSCLWHQTFTQCLRVMGYISQKLSRMCVKYISPQNYILHEEN